MTGAYLVFQPIRFALQYRSPDTRWALTPPFHPYPNWKTSCGGFLSVVLSVILVFLPGHLPVRKYGALCCPDFPLSLVKSPRTATNQPALHKNKLNKAIIHNPIGFY
ncbi:hypothetical protein ADICYQ_2216 [Cyclobacterium qasimii M12-11B]|uniref:Uncharacterized protein n=1 Tax=Cyclobacterium qasimii M12-11B TaxID=641524 RepID=S7VF17_9BACT|nr:hypothetical protein ADICYQ_2216 [Cyclobacterium qasimii M12-11B]